MESLKKKKIVFIVLPLVLIVFVLLFFKRTEMIRQYPDTPHLKAISDSHSSWFNTQDKVKMSDIKGRMVLLYFWKLGDFQNYQLIPALNSLKQNLGEDVLMLGIVSPDYQNQKLTQVGVIKDQIMFPVLSDESSLLRKHFDVQTQRAFILLNPEGKIELNEGSYFDFKNKIVSAITSLKKLYTYEKAQLQTVLEISKAPIAGELRFPTYLHYEREYLGDSLLIISNTGKNQILGVRPQSGEIVFKVGRSDFSFNDDNEIDGDFENAKFLYPHGVTFLNGNVYVADTGHNRIREINLSTKKVSTVVGSKELASSTQFKKGVGEQAVIPFPWDVVRAQEENALILTLSHYQKLVHVQLKTKKAFEVDEADDKPVQIEDHQMSAAPSGVSRLGHRIYYVDSALSQLKVLSQGSLNTMIGLSEDHSGFRNGEAKYALLSRPMGLDVDWTGIYITDTGNHAIRMYDFKDKKLNTLLGYGKPGKLNEPVDLAKFGSRIWISNSNSHEILQYHTEKKELTKLLLTQTLVESTKAVARKKVSQFLPNVGKSESWELSSHHPISVTFEFPNGWKFNASAPSWISLFDVTDGEQFIKGGDLEELKKDQLVLPELDDGKKYRLQGTFYFCENENSPVCAIQSVDHIITAKNDSGRAGVTILLQKP